eukprot:gene5345-6015_t
MERDPQKQIPASALLDKGPSHYGFVLKKGTMFSQKRPIYCILHEGCLYYYKDFTASKEMDAFCILGHTVKEDNEDDQFGISLQCIGKKSFNFNVPSKEERNTWISKLNEEITRIAADGSDSSSEGPLCTEQYDYAYQPMVNQDQVEPQHDYEKTDHFQDQIARQNRHCTSPRPNPNVPGKNPLGPPPAVPTRPSKTMAPKPPIQGKQFLSSSKEDVSANLKNRHNAPFSSIDVPKISPKPLNDYTGSFPNAAKTRPKLPVSKKPVAVIKPELPMKPTLPGHIPKTAEAKKLQHMLQRYELQSPHVKDSFDSGENSEEDYLDIEGEGVSNLSQRERLQPVGGSFKKDKNEEECYLQALPTSQDPDEVLLPKSAYQESCSRTIAESILCGVEGMYLIRKGTTGNQVLSALLDGVCKHYKIFENKEKGTFFLKDTEPIFKRLPDLIRHYYSNHLPTCPKTLKLPYT